MSVQISRNIFTSSLSGGERASPLAYRRQSSHHEETRRVSFHTLPGPCMLECAGRDRLLECRPSVKVRLGQITANSGSIFLVSGPSLLYLESRCEACRVAQKSTENRVPGTQTKPMKESSQFVVL